MRASYVKFEDCNNTAIVTYMPFRPPDEPRAIRVNEWFYYVPSFQEFRPYRERSKVKGDNLESVRKSFNRLKSLINCNYDTPDSVRFVTLTYADNMIDNVQITPHMRQFFKRMRRLYGSFEYIYTKEQQERGAWHMHCVLFFPDVAPYMPNTPEDHPVRDAWGHGFVNVRAFSGDVNNLGNYLCAYLTDDRESSKKGARLMNYASGVRLYNCSRGIKRPVSYEITFEDALSLSSDEDFSLLSESSSVIFDSNVKPRMVWHQLYAKL